MHDKKARLKVTHLLIVALLAFAISMLGSCGKSSTVAPSSSTTKMEVINASPDIGPVYVIIGALKLSSTPFKYAVAPKYIPVFSGEQSTRIADYNNATLFYFNDTLKNNSNYSLFVVGLAKATSHADTLNYIFTPDTDAIPDIGKGKIRFINASPRSPGLDVYANGTQAFSNILYKGISKYIQVPAGIYSFKINPTGTPGTVLTTLSNINVQDGRLYTVFTQGMVGRTDSAAFTAALITNK